MTDIEGTLKPLAAGSGDDVDTSRSISLESCWKLASWDFSSVNSMPNADAADAADDMGLAVAGTLGDQDHIHSDTEIQKLKMPSR